MKKSSYRDINKYKKARSKERHRYYSQTSNSENGRTAWTLREIDMVISHSMPDSELSKLIGRSVQSIQCMRWRIKNGKQAKTIQA